MGLSLEAPAVEPAFWAGRRVLVTGHTGFKGAWLAALLHHLGAAVTGYADAVPTTPSLFDVAGVGQLLDDVRGDVCDADALQRALDRATPEIVIHLAAQSLVRASYHDPVETYRTNVMGTVHVLEAARRAESVRSVLVVTSDKCYENNGRPWAYRESEPLGGRDPYSSSKAAAELVTAAYRESFLRELGKSVATARAGNVIGGGDWSSDRLVPDVVRAAMSDQPVALRHPEATRPWQHVLDCLGGYLLLLQRLADEPALSGAWNFGPDAADVLTVREVVDRVVGRWPTQVTVDTDTSARPHEATHLTLDSAKAREALGWQPQWTALEAIERTVDWYWQFHQGADAATITRREIEAFLSQVTT